MIGAPEISSPRELAATVDPPRSDTTLITIHSRNLKGWMAWHKQIQFETFEIVCVGHGYKT